MLAFVSAVMIISIYNLIDGLVICMPDGYHCTVEPAMGLPRFVLR